VRGDDLILYVYWLRSALSNICELGGLRGRVVLRVHLRPVPLRLNLKMFHFNLFILNLRFWAIVVWNGDVINACSWQLQNE